MQNLRSVLQKRLTGKLSVNGAAYVRFLYAVPFAWAYALWLWEGQFSGLTVEFFVYVSVAAVAQIFATAALLASFTRGNFAVGTAFSKTEAAQAALFGLFILGDDVDAWVAAGIGVSLVGVVLLSGNLRVKDLFNRGSGNVNGGANPAVLLGMLAAAGFAISAVGFRGASLGLADGTYVQRAGLTLVVAVTLQTLFMGLYLKLREPGQIQRVLTQWRAAVWVGAIGMIASAGWFTAMTLQSAGVVRAVGQVELLFTMITSIWILKEKLQAREVLGIALVLTGIWLLI